MRQSTLTKTNRPHPFNQKMPVLSWGKVIARHAEDNTVDVALQFGAVYQHVQIASGILGSQVGSTYLPTHDLTNPVQTENGVWDTPTPSAKGDLLCVVGFLEGQARQPKILGFFNPNQTEMSFSSLGILVSRHESGQYNIILPDGQSETHFSDGSYFIVGNTTPHDMTTENKNWSVKPQGSPSPIFFHHASGLTLEIDTTGKLTINPVNGVEIGGTEAVALASALSTWLSSHTHTSAVAGSPTSAPNQSLPNIASTQLTTG